jgi:sulfur carrier protein
MDIIFNNLPQSVEAPASVQALLSQFVGDKQKGIAVAVNQTVVPKTEWDKRLLRQGDNVLVIKATQGG